MELASDRLARGGRFFSSAPGDAYLPLEFADAAYRYGHSQVRHTCQLQPGAAAFRLFPALVGFGRSRPGTGWTSVSCSTYQVTPRRSGQKMDGALPASLIVLPHQITADVDVDAYRSLAVGDLLRGAPTGLPSGETITAALGVAPLTTEEVGPGWASRTSCGSTYSRKPKPTAPRISSARSAAASSPKSSSA